MALKFAVFRELDKEFGINEEEVETHDYIDHFEIDDYKKIYHDGEFAKATNEQFVSVKRKLEDSDEEEVMDNNIIFDIIQQSKQKESELSTVTSVVILYWTGWCVRKRTLSLKQSNLEKSVVTRYKVESSEVKLNILF